MPRFPQDEQADDDELTELCPHSQHEPHNQEPAAAEPEAPATPTTRANDSPSSYERNVRARTQSEDIFFLLFR